MSALPGDCRAPAFVGRHARLELAFEHRHGRTVIARAYAEPPLRVGRSFDLGGAAYLILVCTGAGAFGGDMLSTQVSLGPGARVVLASQSALQVHPSETDRPSVIRQQYSIGDGAELHCQWDPVIPFAGARLSQQFDLDVAAGGSLYWSDGLMSGRVSKGERWQFAAIDHQLRLKVNGSLAYLERYRLAPDEQDLSSPALSGGGDYFGTTIVRHHRATAVVAERLQADLANGMGIDVAADVPQESVLLGRFLGLSGPAWTAARAAFRDRALADVFDSPHLVARR